MKRIVIVGGGIAGLASAHALMQARQVGGSPLEVTVLEAEDRWGGKIRTEVENGFVVEAGPDTFLATKPWGVALCRELGLSDRLHGTNPRHKNTYVLHRARLTPLPDGLTMMIPTQFRPMLGTRLLSWAAKMRMGLDFLLPPKPLNGDESLGAFVSRRLGRSAYENLIEPLMSGIYAGDGDQLSLKSTFPHLRDLELTYGGLVKGALATKVKMARAGAKKSSNRSVFLTPTLGLGEMVAALVARLEAGGVSLRTGAVVAGIQPEGEGYRVRMESGEELTADGVILATPAYAAAEWVRAWQPALAQDLAAVPYVSTATVSLAYRESDLTRPLDGYGYVIPRREGRRALACTWTSTKFPHRAPENYVLVRVFIGRAGQEAHLPTDRQSLIALAREELQITLGIQAEPLHTWAFYWPNAMPQYNLGHPERLERIQAALEELPTLALAGNGYRGIGVPDCIHSGEEAAHRLLDAVQIQRETEVSR